MNLAIRKALVQDAALIADISRQSFYETFAPNNTKADMDKFLAEQFTRGRLMLEVGRPQLEFYLAYADEAVAGYVKLRPGRMPQPLALTPALEIARLYCLKDFIGKGIGRALMEKSLQRAEALGAKAVWLGVWEHNQRAIDFYNSFGFEKFGETDFLLGEDMQRDWLMWRKIASSE